MTEQLLIYESAVPVSAARHASVSPEPVASFAFSAGINAVPLMAVKLLRAATEYAIVFTKAGEYVVPAVVPGVRGDQNLYLSADQKWQARHIPAFIRRYPFVFSSSADGKTLTLWIDESHPRVNREGRGERLFGDEVKPWSFVGRVLEFLKNSRANFQRTRQFCRRV